MNSSLDQCIKCSICTAYCPVLKATGLFPGPKISGPDAARFRLGKLAIPSDWLELCDYCKICEMVCPSGVPISDLHLQARKAQGRYHWPRLRDFLLAQSSLIGKLGIAAAPFSNRLTRSVFLRWLLDRGLAIDKRAILPFYPEKTFVQWFRNKVPIKGEPLAYFHGCYTNYIDPEIGKAVVAVLEKNGYQMILPELECCGLPLIGNGFFHLATKLAQKNVKTLGQFAEKGIKIVFSSPSCGMTIKREYERILNLSEAAKWSDRILDVFQFLLALHEEGKLNLSFKPIHQTLYYHVPCHLRALQIGLPGLELLSLIPGLEVKELPENCCGLAGTYGFKKEKYDIAIEIGKPTFQAIRELGVKKVISDCEACRMQIEAQCGVQVLHPIQILKMAYEG